MGNSSSDDRQHEQQLDGGGEKITAFRKLFRCEETQTLEQCNQAQRNSETAYDNVEVYRQAKEELEMEEMQKLNECLQSVLNNASTSLASAKDDSPSQTTEEYSLFNLNIQKLTKEVFITRSLLEEFFSCLVPDDAQGTFDKLKAHVESVAGVDFTTWLRNTFQQKHEVMVDWLLLMLGLHPPKTTLLYERDAFRVPEEARKKLQDFGVTNRLNSSQYDTGMMIVFADNPSAINPNLRNRAAQLFRDMWIASLNNELYKADGRRGLAAIIAELNNMGVTNDYKYEAKEESTATTEQDNAESPSSIQQQATFVSSPSLADQRMVLHLMRGMEANRFRNRRLSPRFSRPTSPQVFSRERRRSMRSQRRGPSSRNQQRQSRQSQTQSHIAALMNPRQTRPRLDEDDDGADQLRTMDGLLRQFESRSRSRPRSRSSFSVKPRFSPKPRSRRSSPRSKTGSKPKSRPRSKTGSKPKYRPRPRPRSNPRS